MKRRSGSALGGGGLSLLVTWASLALVTGCSSETTGGLPPLLTADGATPSGGGCPYHFTQPHAHHLSPRAGLCPHHAAAHSARLTDPPQFGPGVVLMSISRLHRSLTEWT